MTSIHKSFLVSLAAFLGISIIMQVISEAVAGTLMDIADDPFSVVAWLFQGILYNFFFATAGLSSSIFSLVDAVGTGGDIMLGLSGMVSGLGFFLAPLIAAILAGVMADSKVDAFFGWLLTLIVSWLVWSIFFIIGDLELVDVGSAYSVYYSNASIYGSFFLGSFTLTDPAFWIFMILMLCVTLVTSVSWGVFPLTMQKETFY